MKLSSSVLSVMRQGALGGAVALAAACSSSSSPIHREPAAQLAPVVVVTPVPLPLPAAPLPVPPATLVAAVAVADAGAAVVVADAADAGTRRHRRRHDGTALLSSGTQDPNLTGIGTLGYGGLGRSHPGAGCGRG